MAGNGVPWWRCRRYWLSALLFVGCSIFTILRANLSIIILCMVKHPNQSHVSEYNTSEYHIFKYNTSEYNIFKYNTSEYNISEYSTPDVSNTTTGIHISVPDRDSCAKKEDQNLNHEGGEFEWNKQLQGILLGGYFWGYSSGFQILGGWLAQRYGVRKVLTLGLLPMAIGNLLSPVAVRVSPYLLFVIRVITGVSSGVFYPCAPVFWSRWAPPDEWSRLLSTTFSGGEFGHAVVFPINGLLCKYGGWELPFYVMGGVCLVWCIIWAICSRDSPSQMPGISAAEKKYIETAIGERMTSTKTYKTPWCSIVRSRPVWACICTHMFMTFFFYMILTQGPTYLHDVMNFDITANGFFSSLPFIASSIVIVIAGAASDWLTRNYLSVQTVRKLMNTIGMVLSAIFLLGLAYVPCSNPTTGVALFTTSVGVFAFCFSGVLVNMPDIALRHSGTLFGLSNTLAALPGIIAPYVVAHITKEGSQEEWRIAFIIAVVTNLIAATVFLLFSSAVPQPWALPQELTVTVSDNGHVENQEPKTTFIVSKKCETDVANNGSAEEEKFIPDSEETVKKLDEDVR